MHLYFEILRQKHGIFWTGLGAGVCEYHRAGQVVTYTDDEFGSVTGKFLAETVVEFPQYSFCHPATGVLPDIGLDVGGAIDRLDRDTYHFVAKTLADAEPDHYGRAFDDYNRVAAVLTGAESDFAAKASMFAIIHRTLVQMRSDVGLAGRFSDQVGPPTPPVEGADVLLVISGKKRQTLRLIEAQPDLLREVNRLYNNEGTVEEDNCQLTFNAAFDPFCVVRKTTAIVPSVAVEKAAGEQPRVDQKSAPIVVKPVPPVDPDVQPLYEHWAKYLRANLSNLSKEELIIALFGSQEGEDLWGRMSARGKGNFLKAFKRGERMLPRAFVDVGVQYIQEHTQGNLDAAAMRKMVAARLIAYKDRIEWEYEAEPPYLLKI